MFSQYYISACIRMSLAGLNLQLHMCGFNPSQNKQLFILLKYAYHMEDRVRYMLDNSITNLSLIDVS